ncbi:hypothetical protein DFH28DRAFT_1158336 [Melampsora americana]|nr:hypothetical protein DFH28DRAFT_1158336 [Melampsora americana]
MTLAQNNWITLLFAMMRKEKTLSVFFKFIPCLLDVNRYANTGGTRDVESLDRPPKSEDSRRLTSHFARSAAAVFDVFIACIVESPHSTSSVGDALNPVPSLDPSEIDREFWIKTGTWPSIQNQDALPEMAVHMLINGFTKDEARNILHKPIHLKSFRRWSDLYHKTHSVIQDPNQYKHQGQPCIYRPANCEFIKELVYSDPTLFLDELCDQIYDHTGFWASLSTLQLELHHQLQYTLKKANVQHSKRSEFAQQKFYNELSQFPAKYLVFTDKSAICERDLLRFYA